MKWQLKMIIVMFVLFVAQSIFSFGIADSTNCLGRESNSLIFLTEEDDSNIGNSSDDEIIDDVDIEKYRYNDLLQIVVVEMSDGKRYQFEDLVKVDLFNKYCYKNLCYTLFNIKGYQFKDGKYYYSAQLWKAFLNGRRIAIPTFYKILEMGDGGLNGGG